MCSTTLCRSGTSLGLDLCTMRLTPKRRRSGTASSRARISSSQATKPFGGALVERGKGADQAGPADLDTTIGTGRQKHGAQRWPATASRVLKTAGSTIWTLHGRWRQARRLRPPHAINIRTLPCAMQLAETSPHAADRLRSDRRAASAAAPDAPALVTGSSAPSSSSGGHRARCCWRDRFLRILSCSMLALCLPDTCQSANTSATLL